MNSIGSFPFGQDVRKLEQMDQTPKLVFVLGVYASAVHARWIGPDGKKLVNALVKALRYIQSHTAAEIAAHVPAEFYAGDKSTYIKALARSKPIFIPDGRMPAKGPANVLRVLTRTEKALQGKAIDLGSTYTLEFVNQAR